MTITTLTSDEREFLRTVGFTDDGRAGTSVIIDSTVTSESVHPDVVVRSMKDALVEFDWLQDLMFGLIDPDENELLRQSTELVHDPVGHFVWVRPGAQIDEPIQLFSVLETPQGRQFTHNVTVIDHNARVEMIAGAVVPDRVHAGHHVSIDECYVREGASCKVTSIEHWGPNMESDSYARTRVEAGANVTSTAIQLAPIRRHESHSRTWVGAGAVANDHVIAFAPNGTTRIYDSEIVLDGAEAASESKLRMVTAGGVIVNRSTLVGDAAGTSGFLGCDGLKLGDEGEIESVPALRAISPDSQLSHEASVGMIDPEKLDYLMASGLDEDAARDLIVQGFLDLDELALPPGMADEVRAAIATAKSGSL